MISQTTLNAMTYDELVRLGRTGNKQAIFHLGMLAVHDKIGVTNYGDSLCITDHLPVQYPEDNPITIGNVFVPADCVPDIDLSSEEHF
jgi:hypothetical protein